ncbi:hypothetical protein QBC37DRAFT_427318 [Rhypophila decipiens]|uniref:Uncharacterized protein n=1 Tax=Rhypophila decipiens TaxID=261697 RepID=A0AAN6Y4P7_9PEZI|nr:hypothetical protein QBC37DRAFT_427318 [Rhypophila decipiens]
MSSGLRLYVYIRVTRFPAVVEIEFPDTETGRSLARRYLQSITRAKELPADRQRPHIVAFHLNPSITDILASKYPSGLVLHFENSAEARQFEDDICLPVAEHPRQLFIKQYWDDKEADLLARTLSLRSRLMVEITETVSTLPERAGTPPSGRAKDSHSSQRKAYSRHMFIAPGTSRDTAEILASLAPST